ncbi:DNA methyltransferase [Photobacterium piscicola]|uniref:DNA methyltransferase n=1 Tax=Photobacterium piscicola TaxID=1378299 RepID=A0ABU6LH15_9GAMM|nr:DNA methyltransferase [Photobacterium piscicola]
MNQENLFDIEEQNKTSGPIECLGMTFESDEARRAHFTELLREKLEDPEFRAIEGFPIGTNEAILDLSDPPYYTACPNPWLELFVLQWENEKINVDELYHREPFAADVSEGKSDHIYNAHTYHTKVPHKAIMRYILHYTMPGDLVFDGFCGTGMTGVAAKLCGDKEVVSQLGYYIDCEDNIYESHHSFKEKKAPISKLGVRNAILNDLSPVASFISHNYNKITNVVRFENEAKTLLNKANEEFSWMYETKHSDGRIGKINYTVWSDVFICPSCSNEIIFHNVAVEGDKVKAEFNCSHCNSRLKKRGLDRSFVSLYDPSLNETIKQAKQVPVLINYSIDKVKLDKPLDEFDYDLINKIGKLDVTYSFPLERMIPGKETRRNDSIGLTHVHHYYSKKTLLILSYLRAHCHNNDLLLWFNSQLINLSKLNRYRPGISFPYNPLSGTMYVGSQVSEANIFDAYKNKLNKLCKAFKNIPSPSLVSTQSLDSIKGFKADYIFIDPPFGANLNYSELSSLWESWLGVKTNNIREAIENSAQRKSIDDYRDIMYSCFKAAYDVLKPGGWATVEFSNTKASVWNSIQSSLGEAGFVVANVSALDKQSLSFKAVNTPTAVKQDLIISAYKPTFDFEVRFKASEKYESMWDFVDYHLDNLPIVRVSGDSIISSSERDVRVIFDRMVGYFIRNNKEVPIDSIIFQREMAVRYIERDGMYFTRSQVAKYDKERMVRIKFEQISIFVSDENSAIEWLRQKLKNKPQTYSDLHPLFLNELAGWKKDELQLELSNLLSENFLIYEQMNDDVPSQVHSYLSSNYKDMRGLSKSDEHLKTQAKGRWYVPDGTKESDIKRLRLKVLLKEFDSYIEGKGKIKTPRSEALRVGFAREWEANNYEVILDIANRIPKLMLQEDEQLIMFYDNARTLSENSADEW